MILSKEQEYLLILLRDHLHARKSKTNFADVQWNELKRVARSQQLSAIVYAQTKNDLLKADYYQQIIRNVQIEKEVSVFGELMQGIEHCFLKGVRIKEFYPAPMLRSMGDMDVMIHPESRMEVHKRLLENGYIFSKRWKEQWTYRKDNILLEVHDCAILSRESDATSRKFSSDIWNYIKDNELDWNYHFLYVLFHLRRHLISSGAGLRQFMDIAILCEQKGKFDWNWIRDKAKQLNICRFMEQVFSFNEKTFDIKPPFDVPAMEEEFYLYALQKIFDDGVFGFDNPDNREKKILQIMRNKNIGEAPARRRYWLSMIFPQYETMCECPYIGYLEGHKYLLLFAWIHRGIHGLCRGTYRKNLKEKLTYMHTDTSTIHTQEDELSRWGI